MALEIQRIDPWDGDSGTGITYYGYATAGTGDDEQKWSIKKKVVDSGVLKYLYPYVAGDILPETSPAITATGVEYIKMSGLVWANRTGYTYK